MESQIAIADVGSKLKKEQKKLFIKRFISNKMLMVGSLILFLILLIVLFGPMFMSYTPYEIIENQRLQGPNSNHILGVDNFGRDLLSRIVYGTRISMLVGLSVTIITTILGLIIGLYSTYYRTLDHILMRICDGLMSIPGVLLAIALMSALGSSPSNIVIALSIVFTPYVARVVRSAALSVSKETYIEAMKSQGASSTRIIWRHIAPNILSPLVVQATFIFADTIITEASLSFLGAGVPVPDPSWGNILYDGKLEIFTAWWMVVFPGIMIVLAVLGLNLIGDGLRDFMDPHIQNNKRKKIFRLFKRKTKEV